MMAATNRILVYIKNGVGSLPKQCQFTQSIVDTLDGVSNSTRIFVDLEGDKLLVSKSRWKDKQKAVKMKRPSFCPIHSLSADQSFQLPPAVLQRGVDVGCAVIVESCDGHVLLTQRALNLHTFPGVWVPPGGHIEPGETLEEAGLRELREESGLVIGSSQCVGGVIPIIAMWESSYPPHLSLGPPRRHHAVVYLHAQLTPPYTAQHLQKDLRLEKEEVAASAWIDRGTVEALVRTAQEAESNSLEVELTSCVPTDIPATFRVTTIDSEGIQTTGERDTRVLFNSAVSEERVSTGTQHALAEWLALKAGGNGDQTLSKV